MFGPSIKIIALSIVGLGLISGIILFDHRNKSDRETGDGRNKESGLEILPENIEPANFSIEFSKDLIQSTEDTDGDGLLDWEETFRGTDINNEDTDGDGTTDGEEIKLNRHPLVPAPNDELNNEGNLAILDPLGEIEGTFSEEKMNQYLDVVSQLKSKGDLSDEEYSEVAKEAIKVAAEEADLKQYYLSTDLELFENSNKDLLKDYANNLAIINNSLALQLEIIPTNLEDEEYLNQVYETYLEHADKLANISVPNDMVGIHLKFTNNTRQAGELFKILSNTFDDPLKTYLTSVDFYRLGDEQPLIFNTLAKYIKSNDIIFDKYEPGNFWLNYSNNQLK